MKKSISMIIAFFALSSILESAENKIETVPLFQSCGVYFKASDTSTPCITEFREKGTERWNKALELTAIPEKTIPDNEYRNPQYIDKAMFRGAIVNLKENTSYELKITQGKNTYTSEFKTWNPNPPVAKTVNMRNLKLDKELIITEKGTKDGWIKYTADKDFILKSDDKKNAAITVKGGEYIIIENLKIEGGAKHGISLEDSKNIRVLNCDISGYGRIGKQDVKKDGKYYDDRGNAINNDAGVNIARSGNVVVERCYMHDPRGHANAWKYSHPAGPNAVAVHSTGGTVLRYNDFIGSDAHRWNDTVEGHGNGSPTGGFFRDAEICGNMFIYANDDSIELDGGQMNIRVFLNKMEGSLCGISTGPCLLGPSYLFKNLIVNLADEDGFALSAFKNGHGLYDRGRAYVFNNTIYANGGYGHYNNNKDGIEKYGKELRGITRNNIFYCSGELFSSSVFPRGNDFDYDLIYSKNPELLKSTETKLKEKNWEQHGIIGKDPDFKNIESADFIIKKESPAAGSAVAIDNFIEKHSTANLDKGAFQMTEELPLPYRPIPLYLDQYQLNFKFDIGRDIRPLKIEAKIKGAGRYSENFEIRKNDAFDWFTVEPAKGTFKENSSTQFKIMINKEKIKDPGLYKGLFLIRMENGYSRPVTVYAKAEGDVEIKKKGEGFAFYIEAETPSSNQPFKIIEDKKASASKSIYIDIAKEKDSVSYDFEVPKDNDYFIFLRMKGEEPVGAHASVFISVDGEDKRPAFLKRSTEWCWSGTGAVTSLGTTAKPITLKQGKHTVKISPRQSLSLDLLLITDNYKLAY